MFNRKSRRNTCALASWFLLLIVVVVVVVVVVGLPFLSIASNVVVAGHIKATAATTTTTSRPQVINDDRRIITQVIQSDAGSSSSSSSSRRRSSDANGALDQRASGGKLVVSLRFEAVASQPADGGGGGAREDYSRPPVNLIRRRTRRAQTTTTTTTTTSGANETLIAQQQQKAAAISNGTTKQKQLQRAEQSYRNKLIELRQKYVTNRAINDRAYYVLLAIYSLLITFGTISNSLICLTVILKPRILSPRNIFIVNLAGSDLLLCVFTMPFAFIEVSMKMWPMGLIPCKLVAGLQATSIFVSTISITAIALDRYKVIVYPTHQETASGIRGAALILASVWIGALLLSTPLFTFRTVEHYGRIIRDNTQPEVAHNGSNHGNQSAEMAAATIETIDFCIEAWPFDHGRGIYSTISIICQYVLPITIVSYVYTRISSKLQKRLIRRQRSTQLECQQKRQLNLIKRTHTMLISVSLVFGLSWLPLNLLNVLSDFSPSFRKLADDESFRIVFAICHLIGCSSACSNPILYGFLNENFRKEFHQVHDHYVLAVVRFTRRLLQQPASLCGRRDRGNPSAATATAAAPPTSTSKVDDLEANAEHNFEFKVEQDNENDDDDDDDNSSDNLEDSSSEFTSTDNSQLDEPDSSCELNSRRSSAQHQLANCNDSSRKLSYQTVASSRYASSRSIRLCFCLSDSSSAESLATGQERRRSSALKMEQLTNGSAREQNHKRRRRRRGAKLKQLKCECQCHAGAPIEPMVQPEVTPKVQLECPAQEKVASIPRRVWLRFLRGGKCQVTRTTSSDNAGVAAAQVSTIKVSNNNQGYEIEPVISESAHCNNCRHSSQQQPRQADDDKLSEQQRLDRRRRRRRRRHRRRRKQLQASKGGGSKRVTDTSGAARSVREDTTNGTQASKWRRRRFRLANWMTFSRSSSSAARRSSMDYVTQVPKSSNGLAAATPSIKLTTRYARAPGGCAGQSSAVRETPEVTQITQAYPTLPTELKSLLTPQVGTVYLSIEPATGSGRRADSMVSLSRERSTSVVVFNEGADDDDDDGDGDDDVDHHDNQKATNFNHQPVESGAPGADYSRPVEIGAVQSDVNNKREDDATPDEKARINIDYYRQAAEQRQRRQQQQDDGGADVQTNEYSTPTVYESTQREVNTEVACWHTSDCGDGDGGGDGEVNKQGQCVGGRGSNQTVRIELCNATTSTLPIKPNASCACTTGSIGPTGSVRSSNSSSLCTCSSASSGLSASSSSSSSSASSSSSSTPSSTCHEFGTITNENDSTTPSRTGGNCPDVQLTSGTSTGAQSRLPMSGTEQLISQRGPGGRKMAPLRNQRTFSATMGTDAGSRVAAAAAAAAAVHRVVSSDHAGATATHLSTSSSLIGANCVPNSSRSAINLHGNDNQSTATHTHTCTTLTTCGTATASSCSLFTSVATTTTTNASRGSSLSSVTDSIDREMAPPLVQECNGTITPGQVPTGCSFRKSVVVQSSAPATSASFTATNTSTTNS